MNSGVAVIVKAVKVANKVNQRTWIVGQRVWRCDRDDSAKADRQLPIWRPSRETHFVF